MVNRALRRHHLDRMKRKAASLLCAWHGRRGITVKSERVQDGVRIVEHYTARELQAILGKLAAMHGTHECFMCHHEKYLGIPHIKSRESVRIIDLAA